MRLSFTECLGRDPTRYAQAVLKACGIKTPPICEKTVADHLKLKIEEIPDDEILAFTSGDPDRYREFLKIIQVASAGLKKIGTQKTIMLYQKTSLERKRLNVFHECSHADIPWHKQLNFLCHENPISQLRSNRIEREAFACAAELMMPKDMFSRDLMSMDTSIATISMLHGRYVSSMEATVIRYASLHPGFCSVVLLEPAQYHQNQATSHVPTSSDQLRLSFEVEQTALPKTAVKSYPYRVKYSVKSRRFPQYIRPGRGIDEHAPIFSTQVGREPIQMEIPAKVFGSSSKYVYNAECVALGNTGTIMVLLSYPDRQTKTYF